MRSSTAKLIISLDMARWNLRFETFKRRIHRIWAMQCWQKHLVKHRSRKSRWLNRVNFWMAAATNKLVTSLELGWSNLSFDTLRCRIHSMWAMKAWQKRILVRWTRRNRRCNWVNFWMPADTVKLIISLDLPWKSLAVDTLWCPIHYL